jgi:hypothetical protein
MSRLRNIGRAISAPFAPGRPPPPLSDAEARVRLKTRMSIMVQFLISNGILYLVLRGNPEFVRAGVDRFFAFVGATLLLDGLLSLAFMRRAGRPMQAALVVCTMLETASIVVWIWATGLAASYFCLAPMIFIAIYRFFYDHSVALTGFLTAFIGLVIAQQLQRSGLIEIAPLLRHPAIGSYATRAYEDATIPNVLILLVLTFVGTNVGAQALMARARALVEAQDELRRLRAGRREHD